MEAGELSDENYKTILNNMGDPVFVKDDQSRLVLVNDAFCEVFGRARAHIIGKTLAEDVTPEERDHFLKIDRQVISDGRESIVEERLTIRGGGTRIISTRKTRFIDKTGNKFLVGVIRDITERKQAAELEGLNQYNEFLLKSAQILSRNETDYKVALQEFAVEVSLFLNAVCDISMLDEESGIIRPEALHYPDSGVRRIIQGLFESIEVKAGSGLVGSVIASGKEVLIEEVPEHMKIGPRSVDPRIIPVSIMYVPLKGSLKVLGSLNLTRLQGQPAFDKQQADQIRRLGDYVSLFVENSLLKQQQKTEAFKRIQAETQLEEEYRWAGFKLDVSAVLADVNQEVSKILQQLAIRITDYFDVVCDIQLVDHEKQTISLVALHHHNKEVKKAILSLVTRRKLKIGQGMVGMVVQSGKEFYLAELTESIRKRAVAENVDPMILPGSLAYLPMSGQDRILGTIDFTRLSHQAPISEDERVQMRDLASHVSRFIENRLLQQQQRKEIELRKKVEHQLEVSSRVLVQKEAETRMMLNAIPIYIARVSKDFRYLFLNEAYRQMGIEPRELEGRNIEHVLGPEMMGHIAPQFAKVLAGEFVTYHHSGKMADGVERYFDVSLAPEYDGSGEIVGFYSCSIDTTSLVKAERESKISQDRFESLSLNSGDAFFFHDIAQNILDVNQVATDMLGYSRQELLGMKASDIDPRWHGKTYQKFLERLEINTPQTFDTTIITKSGAEIPVESRFVKRQEGDTVYIQSLIRDRTEKREQEILLQRSEERLRLIFDNVEDHIAIIDSSGVFESINKTSQGHEISDVLGASIFDFNDDEERSNELKTEFEKLKAGGTTFVREGSYIGPDGSKLTYSRKFIGIFHGSEFYKAVLIIRDVTAERDKEHSVMTAVLRGQEQERKRLGAELHDGIGQVLSAISLKVSQLKSELKHTDAETAAQGLNTLGVELQAAIREVRNISHDLMPEVLESLGMKAAFAQLCSGLKDRSGIKVEFDAVDLDPTYDPLIEVNLYRIAQELLTNAQKHSKCKNLFVSLIDHGDSLNLTVEDDGSGFDPELDANGIGLKNVRSRLKVISGQIDIESAVSSGTLINIEIQKTEK
jgi:PAS domain S-box-containing protein